VRRGRLIQYAAIAAAIVVVVAVGVAAFMSLQTPYQAPTAQSETTPCNPMPCVDVRGYILWVSNLKIDTGLVSMQLTFRNSSSATHADPADLQLIDSTGHSNKAVHDALGCTPWPRTDFKDGAQFGPVPECFRPTSTSPPMRLQWATSASSAARPT